MGRTRSPAISWKLILISSAHAGESVLVTGAGGYIGSALVQAISAARPSHIVLLDSSEHNLFQIREHLESSFGHVPCDPVLGSVNDVNLLDDIFSRHQPEVIYHAAAFKHVPLLEHNPIAAVRNNALGTYTLAQAALRHGTPRLILISTDKTVNPHSVMGVSKRLAELAVVSLSTSECRMSAIRLVNVIGSPGSVVPIFLKQIAGRRPVTVTHSEAARWFMSLNEAVAAILAAGMEQAEGKILLPEVGEQTRIADLAASLISAAEVPPPEVPMVFTGCRPGDKLTEELVSKSDTCRFQPVEIEELMQRLRNSIDSQDVPALIRTLCAVVPEYVPSALLR